MKLNTIVSRLRSKASSIKKLNLQHEIKSVGFTKQYGLVNKRIISLKRPKKTVVAVVVHLYYIDSWESISEKLKMIATFPFDIFVSLPSQSIDFKQTIQKTFPNAFVYESPNRGRDVLPFIAIANALYAKGYKHVLKLHSKKSTHRNDGDDWMSTILDALIPSQPTLQTGIIEALKDSKTGLIGPKGQYVSLRVNFEANGTHMTNIVKKIYSKQQAHDILQVNREVYGFFAGTMFWVNLESIKPLMSKIATVRRFETEAGQIDATFAHALERLFCVIPEIEGKTIYEVDANGLGAIDYSSGIIPDWSNVYIGPQPKK